MDAPLSRSGTTAAAGSRRTELLGWAMDLVTPAEVLAFIADAARRRARAVIANHNLHSLYLVRRSPAMAALYARADLIEVDSRPLLAWAKLLGLEASGGRRCTYLDWREPFWAMAAQRGWRVFHLGGAPGVASKAAGRLMRRWPGVRIETRDGYFDRTPGSEANRAVLDAIAAFRPHVLLVGMGMPIQEEWIAANLDQLDAGAILPVGAAFDYEAGVQRPAPRILGRLGLEWLFRLAHDPRRLFRRYLIEPWSLIGPAARDLVRYRLAKAPPDPGGGAKAPSSCRLSAR